MTKQAELFFSVGEYFAAGFFEEPTSSNAKRFCRAYRRFYENCPLENIDLSAPLFPSDGCLRDREGLAVKPQYCRQFEVDYHKLAAKSQAAAELMREFEEAHTYFAAAPGKEEVLKYTAYIDAWNHSCLDLKRICAEGVNGFEERVAKMENADLKEALLDLLCGIKAYHSRALSALRQAGAAEKLISALEWVPFRPARNAYEAMVSANFMFCFDGCDDMGHMDSWLYKYWHGEDLTAEMHCMMKNLQTSFGWSMSVGPEYNEITRQFIVASKGLARPMIELRVTPDMPNDLWELAVAAALSGGGQPSFYNDPAISERLSRRIPHAPAEDIFEFCGMGCTETAMTGLTYCGGIDSNLNVLKVFLESLESDLGLSETFDEFFERFMARLHRVQDKVMAYINGYYNRRAETCFAPIRTLFTEDCISKELGFYQGGARYTYAVPSDSGIPNTVDSLLTVKKLIFEDRAYTPEAYRSKLAHRDSEFMALCAACPAYGTGNDEADEIMTRLTSRFYAHYKTGKLDLGLGFLPTSHQFTRHICEGDTTPPTPDGRDMGTPVSDSIAAVNGKAVFGPTAMLNSASAWAQEDVYAIPVLNLSINKKFDPAVLRALIEGYFRMGGTQIQITCLTSETLQDAKLHPEKHGDLIVRVGGYSEFFKNLTPELQNAVLERTMFES